VYVVGMAELPEKPRESQSVIYHFDGSAWRREVTGGPLPHVVWAASPSDVFVGGWSGSMRHFDGTAWRDMTTGVSALVSSIWGSAPDNVFATTSTEQGGIGPLLHFDGASWKEIQAPPIRQVWGLAADEIYGNDYNGHAYRFDGTTWRAVDSPCGSIGWGTSPQNLYCATAGGPRSREDYVWRFDGSTWTRLPPIPIPSGAEGFWGGPGWSSSTNDLYLVGNDCRVLGFDGTTWHIYDSCQLINMSGIWGVGSHVFTIGSEGAGMHGSP
jgi:hypothetical protein